MTLSTTNVSTAGASARLARIVEQYSQASVLVIGDLILDHYVWGAVNRISPEAPVVVVDVRQEDHRLGGAGNTAHNLQALGAQVHMCGVVGNDGAGTMLTQLLRDKSINVDGVIVEPGRVTTRKERVIAHSQQVVRIDREVRTAIQSETAQHLVKIFDSKLPEVNAIVVSDYAKGVVVPLLFEAIDRARSTGVIGESALPVIIDPKEPNYSLYSYATVIKPNRTEAESASGLKIVDRASAMHAAERLLDRWNADLILVTLGEDGMVLVGREGSGFRRFESNTVALDVYDVSGAGDTVNAVFALSLAVKAELQDAADLANLAAGIVVAEVGTVVVTRDQLEHAIISGRGMS